MDDAPLLERISNDMPRTIADLERLVRLPSAGYPDYDPAEVRASAEATRDVLVESGVEDARLLELDGGHRRLRRARRAGGSADDPPVRPPRRAARGTDRGVGHAPVRTGPEERPPVCGRGAADDKSGIVAHAAAIRALLAEGDLPATVKVIVEGEEECSTEHLPELVEGNADLLRRRRGDRRRRELPHRCSDAEHVDPRRDRRRGAGPRPPDGPAFRGLRRPGPDAISALARMIASLHDDAGDVVDGLKRYSWEGAHIPEHEFRDECGVLESVGLTGSGHIADRLFTGPAVAVLGIDAPAIAGSSNQIVPSRAHASACASRPATIRSPRARRDRPPARARPWGWR